MAGSSDEKQEWIARVLGVSIKPASGKEPAEGSQMPGQATGKKVAFAHARLAYDTARKQVHDGVGTLTAALRDHFKGEPDFAAIDTAIGEFGLISETLDERLIDTLDQAYTAATPEAERQYHEKALSILAEYQSFAASNRRLIGGIDTNPLVPVAVDSVLTAALKDLAAQLS